MLNDTSILLFINFFFLQKIFLHSEIMFKFVWENHFRLFPGGHTHPESLGSGRGPSPVQSFLSPQLRAPCLSAPWESARYRAASPTQTRAQRAASGCPEWSYPAWKKTAWSSSAPPVTPPWSPYMNPPHQRTHSAGAHKLTVNSEPSILRRSVLSDLHQFHLLTAWDATSCFAVRMNKMWPETDTVDFMKNVVVFIWWNSVFRINMPWFPLDKT